MNAEDIKKTLSVFKTDNGLHEIRIFNTLNTSENYSGIFDDEEALIREIQKFDKDPYMIYFVFNEIKDAVRGFPQLNKFLRRVKAVVDGNIKYRHWLMIDLDPIREGGVKEIPSTEQEKENARLRAGEVYKYLKGLGFPDPVVCMSGNGSHLMYHIDKWANTSEIDEMIANFLHYLAMRFTDEKVDCDVKNKNAARLTKFYGAVSRKGGNTEERPHRKSEIVYVPKDIQNVDFDLVKNLSDEYVRINKPEQPNIQRNDRQFNQNKEPFNIDDFLIKNGIEVLKDIHLSNNDRKIVLKTCPFHPEHGKDSAIFVNSNGAITFTCFHASCQGNDWRKLRLMFDPHAYDYENRPQQQYQQQVRYMQPPKKKYEIKEESSELGKKWFSMSDIKKVDLSSLMHIKTGYTELDKRIVGLYEGEITIISGSNSSGKSSWINNLILNVIQQNIKVALWSGELRPDILKTWILLSAAGINNARPSQYDEGKYYVPESVANKIDRWMDGKFFLYNNEYTNKWEQIFNDMNELVKLGVKLLILDNLFSLDIDIFEGDKNNKQKELILQLCDFVKKNKVHVILVAHPRKVTTFLRKTDISGTSDLTNAASNVFIVHRVNNDFVKAGGEFLGNSVVQQYSMFGNCIEIAKNRLYGVVDCLVGMYYEIPTRRFKNTEEENIHYGWEEQPTQQQIQYEQPKEVDESAIFAPMSESEAPF